MPGSSDLPGHLRYLTPVRKGQKIKDALTADRLNAIQDSIRSLARGENIVQGANVKKRSGDSWVMLTSDKGSKSAPGLTQIGETPFEVVPLTDNFGNVTQLGVIANSHLLNSEDRDSYEDNSAWGLLNEEQTSGGFNISGLNFGDKIWLEIRLNPGDQSIAGVTVRHGPVGGTNPWDEFPNPISINTDDPSNPYQEFYNQIIAEITDPNQDFRSGFLIQKGIVQMQVTQLLFTNLMLVGAHTAEDADQPNLPLVVATAWNGPGTGTNGDGGSISVGNDIMTPWVFGELTVDDNPFQVVSVTYSNGSSQIGVVSNSHLFNSEDEDSYEEPNSDWGLLDPDRSTGWFDAGNAGDKIWLEISLNQDQSIDAIDIKHGVVGSGPNWPNYPDPVLLNTVDPNNVFQSQYNQIVAEVTVPDSDPRPGIQVGDVQVTQLLRTNLMMVTAHTTLNATHPDVPLVVALAWNGPGTSFDGNATEISNFANVTTPWALGESESSRTDYSFRLTDATDDTGPKALVSDGEVNGELPQGMGGGDFILALPNDDLIDPGTNGENDIYLQITYDVDGSITSLSINAVSPTNLPESSFGNKIVLLGYVLVHKESVGPPIVTEIHNTHLGDLSINLFPQKYGFQMFDATDVHSTKVLIMDGKINGTDGSDHIPQGMGNDDYIIVVQNDWDIWLSIPYDPDTLEILDPVSIAAGPAIPEDNVVSGVGFNYIQIGYVDIALPHNSLPVVTPHNSLCGDYYFGNSSSSLETGMNTYSFKMRDNSIGSTPRIQILDGNVVDVDGVEHTPQGMGDDEFIVEVADDDAIYMVIVYNRQTGAIINPVTIGIGNAPDDSPGRQVVEIGYVNVTFGTGGDAIVVPHNTLCGDYQFTIDDGEIGFSFQMLDASDTSGVSPVYKVRLLDGSVIDNAGNEHLPVGMGNDALVVPVFDDYTIFLAIPHDNDWNITGPVSITAAASAPIDGAIISYIDIGYVNVDPDGELIIRNVLCGDFDFEPPVSTSGNNYSFQMLNASDGIGSKVLILDGQVFGPSDNGITPSGMGGDNFVITVANNDEVWLVITLDNDSGLITSVTLDKGQVTPEDTTDTKYVTIGYISIDSSGIVHPTNALLGDYSLPYQLDVTGHDDDLNDVNVDEINQINILGAATIRHDPVDPNTNSVDVIVGADVSDSIVTIDNPSLITFTREATVAGRIVEDGGNGEVIIHVPIGVDLAGSNAGNVFDNVELIRFNAADLEDAGEGEVIVNITGRIDVSDSISTIDNAELIHFQGATISSGGGSEVIVSIVHTVDLIGNTGSLDNVELIHFDGANISNQGGGEALVSIIGMIDVAGDGGTALDNAELLTFAGATIQNGGGGEAIVTITPGSGVNVQGDTTTGSTDHVQLLTFKGANVNGPGNAEAVIQVTSQGSGFNVEGDTGAADRINQPTLLHFTGASVSNPATGEADISITGTIDVGGDVTTQNPIQLDNAQLITFHGAPVGVFDGGGGEVVVEVSGMVDVVGINGRLDNVELINYVGASIQDNGGGEVSIEYSLGVDVFGDGGGGIDNAELITFEGATVFNGGGGEAIVQINGLPVPPDNKVWFLVSSGTSAIWGPSTPSTGQQIMYCINGNPGFGLQPPSSGTYFLGSTNGGIQWIASTNC